MSNNLGRHQRSLSRVSASPNRISISADPDSPKYGQHYTQQEVIDLFAPEDNTVEAVESWLIKEGIPASSITATKSKGWLDFVTTSGELDRLLQGQFQLFNHANGKSSQIMSENYVIPAKVASHIDFIAPALGLPSKTTDRRSKIGSSPHYIPAPVKATPLPQQLVLELTAASSTCCNTRERNFYSHCIRD